MSGPTIIPAKPSVDRPLLQEVLRFWRTLLVDADLVNEAVFFNAAEYEEIRIPTVRRRWWGGKREWIDLSEWQSWERETESYRVAIPVGGQRKVGTETCFSEPFLTVALEELRKRPDGFPNLRHGPSQYGTGEDIWWGENIAELWSQSRTLKVHRAIGRAFGYREDRILGAYPDDWVSV